MNLTDAIRHHARVRPYDMAVIHPAGSANYLQLATIATAVAARLREQGIAPGMTVGVFVGDPFLHLVLLLAAMSTGVATASSPPDLEPFPPALRVDAVLADAALPFTPQARVIPVGVEWIGPAAKAQGPLLPAEQGFQDPRAIQRCFTSSGTTGTPKVIGYTGAMVQAMATRSILFEPGDQGATLSAMGLGSLGGWGIMKSKLWHGATLVLSVAPLAMLRAMALYDVRVLRASPQQLQGMLDLVRGRPVRYPHLQRVEIGGASIPPALLLAARLVLCPNVAGLYGSTEAGLVTQAPGALLHAQPDAAGYVLPDTQVRIVDAAGTPLGLDAEGLVQVRTPQMASGYVGDDAATAAAFRDGWFMPGDLGLLRADGLLLLRGRADELVNMGGVKLNPDVVDAFLLTQPGVRDAASFAHRQPGRPDEIWSAVVPGPGFDEAALLEAARARLQSRAPSRIVQMAQIPRNAMGKAMRQQLSNTVA